VIFQFSLARLGKVPGTNIEGGFFSKTPKVESTPIACELSADSASFKNDKASGLARPTAPAHAQ